MMGRVQNVRGFNILQWADIPFQQASFKLVIEDRNSIYCLNVLILNIGT